MSELTRAQTAALIDCLKKLQSGAGIEDCLARYPQHAGALRPYLELRARLIAFDAPLPAASEHAAGRQALLARLQRPVETKSSGHHLLAPLRFPFAPNWLRSPLGRALAVGSLLIVLAGGALGASAAAGVDQAHDVLSTLRLVGPASQPDNEAGRNADEGGATQAGAATNTPESGESGEDNSNHGAPAGATPGADGNAGPSDHRPCLPPALLNGVPALRELFAPCAGGATEEPPSGPATPSANPPREEPTERPGSGNPHATPHRPQDAGPQGGEHGPPTSEPPAHPTPHPHDSH